MRHPINRTPFQGRFTVEQRIYHGNITPQNIATALIARFNRGNLRVTQYGSGDLIALQIASHPGAVSGGPTSASIILKRVEDGVSVQVGKHFLLGTVASLGFTTLASLRNPLNLLGRLDDLAQDIENLQIFDNAWEAIDEVMRAEGASFELSERLKRLVCAYCNTPNTVNEANCIACGAPLGDTQPGTCTNCGFIVKKGESQCPNCGHPIGDQKKTSSPF